MRADFAIFILSHNSPDKCLTLNTLQQYNSSNNYYIVVDNLDDKLDEYKLMYGDKLLVFDKLYYVNQSDTMYQHDKIPLSSDLYARMAIEDFAKNLNLKYFCMLDDDVLNIQLRIPDHKNKKVKYVKINNIDNIFDYSIDFLVSSNCWLVSFATPNLFIGGYKTFIKNSIIEKRTSSNIFIRDVSKEFNWKTIWYVDFNSCLMYNKLGKLTLNIPFIQITCKPQGSQKQIKNKLNEVDNGMGQAYKSSTAFTRAMYCVIVNPSFVNIKSVSNKDNYWPFLNKNNAYPKIISGRYKK